MLLALDTGLPRPHTAPEANTVGQLFTIVAGTMFFTEALPTEPLTHPGLRTALLVVALVHRVSTQSEATAGRLGYAHPTRLILFHTATATANA